jgi:hypothetical protein
MHGYGTNQSFIVANDRSQFQEGIYIYQESRTKTEIRTVKQSASNPCYVVSQVAS